MKNKTNYYIIKKYKNKKYQDVFLIENENNINDKKFYYKGIHWKANEKEILEANKLENDFKGKKNLLKLI